MDSHVSASTTSRQRRLFGINANLTSVLALAFIFVSTRQTGICLLFSTPHSSSTPPSSSPTLYLH